MRYNIITGIPEDVDPLPLWDRMEKDHDKYKAKFDKMYKAEVEVKDTKYFCIVFVADTHFGNPGTDHRALKEQALKIANNKYTIAMLGGDGIDNFIRPKILEALINQTTTPKEQIALFKHWIDCFTDDKGLNHLLVTIAGNHDLWSRAVSGLDWMRQLFGIRKIAYAPEFININVVTDNINYKIVLRHKYRYNSSYNKTHTVKQMLRFGDTDFDIGVVCHHHSPAWEHSVERGLDRLFIRTGSGKILDQYAAGLGYTDSANIAPCVILNSQSREMEIFWNLDNALSYVNFLNKEK